MRNRITALAGIVLLAGVTLAAAPVASAKPALPDVLHPFGSDSGHSYGVSTACADSSDGWFDRPPQHR